MVAILIVLVVVIALIIAGYWFDWTGFNVYSVIWLPKPTKGISLPITKLEEQQPAKTLWDWLQLLIIPFALAIIAIFFNRAERKNEQRITLDNQQEAALQGYINEMSELLLEKHLRESKEGDEVRTIARVRTLTVLPRLDELRKRSILQFLYESGLIAKNKRVITLEEADLSGADLRGTDLRGADLSKANLEGANLERTFLERANLKGVNLVGANLSGPILHFAGIDANDPVAAALMEANLTGAKLSRAKLVSARLVRADLSRASLSGADLEEANLRGARVTPEQLDTAWVLKDATMPDGSKHP
jgi:uncharacterized protein YjbI with pentapeptide repeats